MSKVSKISIFLLVLFYNITFLFANGSIENRNLQSYGSIQLKIVNLTDFPIYFYFNRLYFPVEILSQDEYITVDTLVTHIRTPIGEMNPRFIGIQYNTNEEINIYSFSHSIRERVFVQSNQYIVVVKNSDINFIEGNIDNEYDYYDESLYQQFPRIDWYKQRSGSNNFELTINNDSGSNRVIWIFSVFEERKEFIMENGSTEKYIIDHLYFRLGGMRIQVVERGWTIEQILLGYAYRRTYDTFNLNIRLTENGYEISYY